MLAVMRLSDNPVLSRGRLGVTPGSSGPSRGTSCWSHGHAGDPVPAGHRVRGAVRLEDHRLARAVRRLALLHPGREPALHRSRSAGHRPRRCPRRRTWPRSPGPASCSVDKGQAEAARGARHEPRQGDAPGRAAAGDAGDRAADRQRDDRDAEGHLAAARGPGDRPSCSSSCSRSAARTFKTFPIAGRRDAVLPDRDQRADGRSVLPRAALRPRLRRPQGRQRGRPGPRPGAHDEPIGADSTHRWSTRST